MPWDPRSVDGRSKATKEREARWEQAKETRPWTQPLDAQGRAWWTTGEYVCDGMACETDPEFDGWPEHPTLCPLCGDGHGFWVWHWYLDDAP